ncbi:MAG: hypothetical protein MJZ76_10170, partial [Bacteroidales bacterium]|nr:hypothetical protein [Bacteroidales bacterium]
MDSKRNRIVLWSLLSAFVALNTFCVAKELFLIPLISAAVVAFYLLIFKVDWAMYLMALVTPFSIVFSNDSINLGLSIPAEPLMIMLTALFFVRILYDWKMDKRLIYHPVSIAIYVYLFWLFVTSITSEIPLVSFKFLASKIWFITSSYFMVLQLMKTGKKKWITFFNCYAVGLAVVVLITTAKSISIGLN